MRATHVAGGALVVAVLAAAALWYSAREAAPPEPVVAPAPVAPVAAAGAPVSPAASEPATGVATAAAAKAPASTAVPASDDDVAAVQGRLDAFARGYNARDVAAVERALWQNHAVVRPTGETMYRPDLLAQWAREWTDFRSHELSFVVDQVRREGPELTAVWDLTLLADLVDAQGTVHKMEIHGSQRATWTVSGDDWVLAEPIAYVGFERTIDGDPWPVGQNGR